MSKNKIKDPIIKARLTDLHRRVIKLEAENKQLALTLTTTAIFTNALIKHTGIKNEQLQEALIKAGLEHSAKQLFRSEGANSIISDSGNRDTLLSGTESNRGSEESPSSGHSQNTLRIPTMSEDSDQLDGNGSATDSGGAD